ncbi:hypothetical protein FGE12_12345 [Aggregicoccus sp. 17bor-14]|uniref:hypothetical protein n=1 Tax=Myxococcaceae TaxID=31 RepID=UPI00129CC7AC|nr:MULTISPECIES: hypothetical protein [Myxococcaceae]MBF5043181.1 hypothetical protein [Simulacricoccus sp. 17bor-14]MRI88939.1 hypothetical protein [Aggregicoccus sp. 17bor-14]
MLNAITPEPQVFHSRAEYARALGISQSQLRSMLKLGSSVQDGLRHWLRRSVTAGKSPRRGERAWTLRSGTTVEVRWDFGTRVRPLDEMTVVLRAPREGTSTAGLH